MDNSKDLFKHIFIPKSPDKNIILLLHGTGADEYDLVPLAEMLFPDSSIFSLRGNISEQGMNRFFMRFPDGTFDQESIKVETGKLKEFLSFAAKTYKFDIKNVIPLGYSNGANFALSFILTYPNALKKAVLLHPTLPFEPENNIELKDTKIIVTSGEHDEYTSKTQREHLKETLVKLNTKLKWFEHKGGHELRQEELEFINLNKNF
jgi:phospholipase/carboxylesterase